MKKIYQADFDGSYLGGRIIVRANDEEAAKIIMREVLEEEGYKDDEIREFREVTTDLIYCWDGDY